jgi:hypothetical protein
MNRHILRPYQFCLFVVFIFLSNVVRSASPPGDVVGKITVGYQGWFACPGDGQPDTSWWWHWSSNWGMPSTSNNAILAWPDVRDYTTTWGTEYPNLGNGQQARFFSSYTQQTVDTHFLWMQANGIDTAALQRFCPVGGVGSEGPIRDAMASKVRQAAEAYGRKFYIMYDIGGWTNMQSEIKQDWTNRMNTHTTSSAYARQNGKPVVGIWGMGYGDAGHAWSAEVCLDVINWFKSQGCYVMGGVPREWRTGDGGSRSGFSDVYHAFNMISPWMVGFLGDAGQSDWAYTNLTVPDQADCNAHGIDYQPCVLPGSVHERQRAHGDFMWRQFYNVIRAGCQGIYISMFDEYNESNQIAKTAESSAWLPVGTFFRGLDDDGTPCSADYYLRLTGDGGKMLKGQIPLTAVRLTQPVVYGGDAPQDGSTFHILSNVGGHALDNGGSLADGASATQWTEQTNNANQEWRLASVGNGYFNIICQQSGKALDNGGSTANGAVMKQWTLQAGNINQHWRFVAVGNGYYHIVSRQSSKALDNRGLTRDGSTVGQWDDQGATNTNQNWSLRLIRTANGIAMGTYKVIARHSGKALDVANFGTANGSQVHQWDYLGGANQKWNLIPLGGDQYRLTGAQSGKVLDVSGVSMADGAPVHIWDWLNSSNQKWTITSVGSGYYRVLAVHSGKALEVGGGTGATQNGAGVQQWSYGGWTNQQWSFSQP